MQCVILDWSPDKILNFGYKEHYWENRWNVNKVCAIR